MFASRTSLRPADVAIRAAIVALTLSTAYIHSTLGGLLFTLNAVGYVVAAVAMIVPLATPSASAGSCGSGWSATRRPPSSPGR